MWSTATLQEPVVPTKNRLLQERWMLAGFSQAAVGRDHRLSPSTGIIPTPAGILQHAQPDDGCPEETSMSVNGRSLSGELMTCWSSSKAAATSTIIPASKAGSEMSASRAALALTLAMGVEGGMGVAFEERACADLDLFNRDWFTLRCLPAVM